MTTLPLAGDPAPTGFQPRLRRSAEASCVRCFWIKADGHPGAMARVLEPFAKRNMVPRRWHSAVEHDGTLSIDIQVTGLDAAMTDQIAQGLRQIPGVVLVLTAERQAA